MQLSAPPYPPLQKKLRRADGIFLTAATTRERRPGCRFGMSFLAAGAKMFDTQTEIVGLSAGICTSISLLPQLIKILRHKKAEDISLFYLAILFIGLGLWIWYGALREDVPIVVTNGFSLVINGIIIVLGVRYKRLQKVEAGKTPDSRSQFR